MVVSQKIMVNIIATVFLFLKKNTDMICPKIAPTNESMIIEIELFGVLWKISTPISNIFCPIAVEIARKAPMGKSSRTYFLVIPIIWKIDCLQVWRKGFVSKWVS